MLQRWPNSRPAAGPSFMTSRGRGGSTPTSITSRSATDMCMSLTPRTGQAKSRQPVVCCDRTGAAAPSKSLRSPTRRGRWRRRPRAEVKDVRPVLCLVRDDWFSERFGEVLVCSSHSLVAQLRGQPVTSEPLSPQHVAHITEALRTRGPVARPLASNDKPRAARRGTQKNSKVRVAVTLAAALTTMAVLFTQPAWLTSALRSGSEQFVSLISPATADPSPARSHPPRKTRARPRARQSKER